MAANPDATWTELLKVSQNIIQGLNLVYGSTGTVLPNAQVYVFKFPDDQFRLPTGQVQYPCVQLAPGRLEDVDDAEQDMEDTVMIYPILVAIFFATNQELALNNDALYWRQQIIEAFLDEPDSLFVAMNDSLTDVSQWDCRLAPAPPIDRGLFQKEQLDVSMFYLTFKTTRSRNRT